MQKNINRMDSKAGISFCSTPEIPNILRQRKRRRSWRFRHIREGCRSAGNAEEYLDAGASHVIVTSYIFREGEVNRSRLRRLKDMVGKERIVLDLSCRKKGNDYYIVTNRWQTFTREKLSEELLDEMAQYCDEFLVHGVDVEGKSSGVEGELVELLGRWEGIPVTYAGGIGSMKELEKFKKLGHGKLDFTIGSALDLFGGTIPYKNLLRL